MIGKVSFVRKPVPDKPTPPPWKVIPPGHGHPTEYLCVQIGEDEMYATLEMLPEDARLVVRAVNSHANLLRLLKAVLLFHRGGAWDAEAWRTLMGDREATTKGLCDAIREGLAGAGED